jgi:hypothetical protein
LPRNMDLREIAIDRLTRCEDADLDADEASEYRQEALAYAVLAVVDELRDVREAIGGIEGRLTDPAGGSVGTNLYYLTDFVKELGKKIMRGYAL